MIWGVEGNDPPVDLLTQWYLWISAFLGGHIWIFFSLTGVFWLWMLIECIRKDPERNLWMWIILVVNPGFPLGALVYFVIRYLPTCTLPRPKFLNRFIRGAELRRLEAAARQIGNPHQYIQLGELQRELGDYQQSAVSFNKALERDPQNLAARWGAGQAELKLKNYSAAREHLAKILELDSGYKFGDVSLAYGRVLLLTRDASAIEHMEKHVRKWKHPEALVGYATLLLEKGLFKDCREQIETLIIDYQSAPAFYRRKIRGWVFRGKAVLRKIPKAVK